MIDAVARFESLLAAPDLGLTPAEILRLTTYYECVLRWNQRLHLTTLTSPEDFLDRHFREPLIARSLIAPQATSLHDLGSGLGVPGVPLSILLPHLTVKLVESSRKKAIFLEEVADRLAALPSAVHSPLLVDCRRIEDLPPLPPLSVLTARAVERMSSLFSVMLRLGAASRQILFFTTLRQLPDLSLPHTLYPLSGSDSRVILLVDPSSTCST